MKTRKRPIFGIVPLALAAVLVLTGCGSPTATTEPQDAAQQRGAGGAASAGGFEMPHIHGLGFSADGSQLVVPAHNGLRIFSDSRWQIPEVPTHDYMGYAPADNGFYSSGHPGQSTGLVNPLGLVKSTDGGKTLTTLGFEGESDFHLMGVGYKNHAVYVLNPAPNSKLPAGMHYSLDDGESWKQSSAQGLTSQPTQIAVHPTDAGIVAVATEAGLFLSSNNGDTFERVEATGPVTAATFSPDATRLLFSSDTLSVYDVKSKQIRPLGKRQLPAQDAIAYIAVNTVRADEIAIATFGRNIFRSTDSGQTWQQIAQNGKAN